MWKLAPLLALTAAALSACAGLAAPKRPPEPWLVRFELRRGEAAADRVRIELPSTSPRPARRSSGPTTPWRTRLTASSSTCAARWTHSGPSGILPARHSASRTRSRRTVTASTRGSRSNAAFFARRLLYRAGHLDAAAYAQSVNTTLARVDDLLHADDCGEL